MTDPNYRPAPKRLERSRSDKFLFGVCGGVAKYLNMDPTLVRVLTAILTLVTGIPVIVYLVAVFVMPEESPTPPVYPPVDRAGSWPAAPFTADPPRTGSAPDPVWGTEGAPWESRPNGTPADTPAPAPHPADERPEPNR